MGVRVVYASVVVLPLASCAADVPVDVCCSTFFDVADRIRCVAFNALVACDDTTCADREFRSYVTHGTQVQEALGDSLVVNVVRVSPTGRSRDNNTMLLPVGVWMGRVDVHLFENGWPQGETYDAARMITAPDSDMVHAIARHSYGHGEKMYRALIDGIQRRTLFTLPANAHIGKIDISDLIPKEPTGPVVGWQCSLAVQMTFPQLMDPPPVHAMISPEVITAEQDP